jgi:hypothetical protein
MNVLTKYKMKSRHSASRLPGAACFLGLLMGYSATGSAAITFDGKYDGLPAYTAQYNVTYDVGTGTPISGGTLAFGQTGTAAGGDIKQYVYYSHPLGFKDNSYGTNSVGWSPGHGGGVHKQSAYAGSEHFEFGLDGCSSAMDDDSCTGGGFNIYIQYEHPEGPTPGSPGIAYDDATQIVFDGDGGAVVEGARAITTAQYNQNQHPGVDFSSGSTDGFGAVSPDVVNDPMIGCGEAGSPGTGTNTSSAEECYELVDPVAANDWQFEAGLELQFMTVDGKSAFFGDGVDFANLAPGDVEGIFSLIRTHASPPKSGVPDPIDQTVTEKVPEPETIALFALGLLLVQRINRRRRPLSESDTDGAC